MRQFWGALITIFGCVLIYFGLFQIAIALLGAHFSFFNFILAIAIGIGSILWSRTFSRRWAMVAAIMAIIQAFGFFIIIPPRFVDQSSFSFVMNGFAILSLILSIALFFLDKKMLKANA